MYIDTRDSDVLKRVLRTPREYLGEGLPTFAPHRTPFQFGPVVPALGLGTLARMEFKIKKIVDVEAEKRLWRPAGSLLPRDGAYRVLIQYPGQGNQNQFRRFGFQGYNKCNVFALDLPWRSGFMVPVPNARTAADPSYSYPLANSLTSYAHRSLKTMSLVGSGNVRWGWLGTSLSADEINRYIEQDRPCLLAGWRRSGIGHVGIIRRIIRVITNQGRISDITYDGWEATGKGSEELKARHWPHRSLQPRRLCERLPLSARHAVARLLRNPHYRADSGTQRGAAWCSHKPPNKCRV